MERPGHQRQSTMDFPSTASPHASEQVSNENIEASHRVTGSETASSLPFRPILSADHEGTSHRSFSDEDKVEESTLPQTIGASKKTKREKQREKRRLKRASKCDATEVTTGQARHEHSTKNAKKMRHRPSPAQRSATALMQMDQWSRLFLNWTPSLSSPPSNRSTAEALSKAVEMTWAGKSRNRTFRSTQELDRFVSVKDSELRFLKTSLHRASVLQRLPSKSRDSRTREEFISSLEPLFQAWEADRNAETEKDEVLQEAPRFFTDTIIPCLEAQLAQLRQRLDSARTLKERLDKVEAQLADREEAGYRLTALVEDRSCILPICPAWNQLSNEIEELQRTLDKSKSLPDLREDWGNIVIEYRRSLEWV